MIGEFIKITNNVLLQPSLNVNNSFSVDAKVGIYPYKANIIVNNQEFVKFEGNINRQSFDVNATFNDETFNIKLFGQASNIDEAAVVGKAIIDSIQNKSSITAEEIFYPKIFDNAGNEIATYESLVGGSGIKTYQYYKVTIRGKAMFVYSIIIGHKGNYMCVLDESGQTIGIVSAALVVKNNKFTDTIYVLNKDDFKYVVLATIGGLINFQEDGVDVGEGLTFGVETSMTVQPAELKAKFDTTFIDRVRASVPTESLPENMPLVKEYKTKAQNTGMLIYRKIMFFIVFAIIIFAFIFAFIKK